ncbi:hypothetical protein LPJ73_003673, partial [Coemansia sp. RSA 2703]
MYRKLHIHGAYTQRQAEYNDEQRKLEATAGKLDSLKFYLDTVDQTLAKFGTSPIQGLEDAAISRRRERDGPNTLSSPPNRIFLKLFEWLFSGFCPLLWIAAIFVWISWKPLGRPSSPQYLVLGIAILITTSRVMSLITGMLPSETMAMRNGQLKKILASELVQGDIVHVRGGDKVPADLRMIETTWDLCFDRSMLTGESDTIVATVDHTDDNYLETRNIAVMGTHVTQGSGVGVVVATGDSTVMGRIAKMTASKKNERTLLQIEIIRFVIVVAILSLCISTIPIIIWAAWLRKSFPTFLLLSDALVNSGGVIVAFVPEGLPICLTLTLTLIAKRMQRQNVLTGTLTQNRMSVVNAGFIDFSISPSNAKLRFDSATDVAMQRLYEMASLCNSATFDPTTLNLPTDERVVNGDATDSAILRFAENLRPVSTINQNYHKLYEIPFNSKNKWMLSLRQSVAAESHSSLLLLVKGAPDVLLPRCTSIQDVDGQVHQLDKATIDRLQALQHQWASCGQRVLMLCRHEFTDNPFADISNRPADMERAVVQYNGELTVVGLVGIEDPPRKEIPHVVDTCRQAGIRVFMVTGDFALTAAAIARQCHIITNDRVDTIEDIRAQALSQAPGAMVDMPSSVLAHTTAEKITLAVTSSACNDGIRSLVLSGSELVGLQNEHWDIICGYSEI